MLYLIVCSHQILPSGRFLTAYKSIQKITFHQKTSWKHKSVNSHRSLDTKSYRTSAECTLTTTSPQQDARACTHTHNTTAAGVTECICFVDHGVGWLRARIAFRWGSVALRSHGGSPATVREPGEHFVVTVVWGSADSYGLLWLGSARLEPRKTSRHRPPVCAGQWRQTSATPLVWQSQLDNGSWCVMSLPRQTSKAAQQMQ